MTIARLRPMLDRARAEGYGVLAINVVDDLTLRAVVRAAEELSAPLIVQTSVKTVRALGVTRAASYFRQAAEAASVPVVLHLDHCMDRDVLRECLRAGWNSVLFDGSELALDDVTTQTREVVDEARAAGAEVEGEIEGIQGIEDGVGSDDASALYPVEIAIEFIRTTGIDCFAPAIGNAHGAYRQLPRLDVDRVDALVAATDLPMALHGGTGLTAEQFGDLIRRGCAKVNISTALKHAYVDGYREYLHEHPDDYEPLRLDAHVAERVRRVAAEHIELFGSAGRVR